MSDFNISFPIDMVKREQRIVVGIATADNIDKAGDIVDFEASKEAFANWGGNIREMHAPIAVGKAVSYEPIVITGADGASYNAVKVEAYISKGAEDTWQKVLDGTLRSFSIGGKVIEKSESADKMFRGKPVNIIKKYVLGELSLVDNPANALAIIDIVKVNDEGLLKYALDCDLDCQLAKAKQPLKDPKGGLTAAGRRHFKETEGANLKPGVRGAADTPEKMRRKGSFLTRFFTNPSGPMKKPNGEPTRLALSAAAWGEPVPQNRADAARLAAKGRRLLERYANSKKKGFLENDFDEDLLNVVLELMKDQGCDCGCNSCEQEGEKKGSDGSMVPNCVPNSPTEKTTKSEMSLQDAQLFDTIKEMIEKMDSIIQQDSELQLNDTYDKISDMNEQEINKLSLLKKFIGWLVPDVAEETTSTSVEVSGDTQEEEMDINVLKDALSAVVDEKLASFATSIKEEVEASVQEKIEAVAKGFEVQSNELQQKLETAELALAEQTEKVEAFAAAGAVKKSVDPEDDEEVAEEALVKSAPTSFWRNTYLPQELINSLGYRS